MGNWWERKALDQSTHERINAAHYPGTRQLCCECGDPTGRCEEDDMRDYETGEGPFCEECWADHRRAHADRFYGEDE